MTTATLSTIEDAANSPSKFSPPPLGPDNPFSYDQMAASEDFLYAMESQWDSSKADRKSGTHSDGTSTGGIASMSLAGKKTTSKLMKSSDISMSLLDEAGSLNLRDVSVEVDASLPLHATDGAVFERSHMSTDYNNNPFLVHKGIMV